MTCSDIEKDLDCTGFSQEQKAYAVSKAWLDFLRKEDADIKAKVIRENEFFFPVDAWDNRKGERISEADDYCILVNDEAQWRTFLSLYYAECRDRGLEVKDGKTIDADARKAFCIASRVLAEWFFEQIRDFPTAENLSDMSLDDVRESMKLVRYRNRICDIAMRWKKDWKKKAVSDVTL